MSYRIVYGPMPKRKPLGQGSMLRVQLMAVGFALLFVFLVRMFWPDGLQALQSVLIPGEAGITEAAFGEMVSNLREGQPMGEAVTAFCRQVIDGAEVFN